MRAVQSGGTTILPAPGTEDQVQAGTAAGSGEPVAGARDTASIPERCAWSLVWLLVVLGGLAFWGSWSSWPPGAYLAPLVVLLGIVGGGAVWLARDPRCLVLQVAALATSLAATLGHEGTQIHTRQYYSTDSGAFNQVAAHLLVHGSNPYTSSLASASNLLHIPADYWTYTAAGGHVTAVSYPAGSFLMEVPALLLGFHHQITDWMDLLAWLVTGALIFVLLPASVRWVGPLLVAVPLYGDVFGSGGTDAVFLPFLVLAVWRWDRFCAGRGAGLARWVGPIALGLACSIKQTPWFCVPFLALGLYLEARAAGRRPLRIVGGYLAIVVGVFGAVNLPFIIWQPTAWARGTVLPFSRPLVADGQGLVSLALHGVVGGASLPLLSVAGALVFVSLLAALVVWYPGMKRVWMLVLPLTFFVGPRSLLTYLIDLFPAAVVAAVTVADVSRPAHARPAARLRMPFALAALIPAAAAVAVAVLAFTNPPLQVDVTSFYATHAATLLDSVTVDVHNTTGETVVPHFMVTIGSSHPTGFWHTPDRRPVVLGPHASAVVVLRPPTFTGAPTHGSFWLVQAYTSSPVALSNSALQHWHLGKIK